MAGETQRPLQLAFPVPAGCDGWLLRDFLKKAGVSATLARQVKRAGGFFLDEAPLRADQPVRGGAVLRFCLPPEPQTSVPAQDIPLVIRYESLHALVLDKPAGMAVHPTLGYPEGTLANGYMGLLRARGQAGAFRPVNRLDVTTSGLVLAAKNAWAAPLLAQSAQKWYTALLEGRLPARRGIIDAPIARTPGSIVLRQASPEGRPSRTEYETLACFEAHTLVRARTVTGRTHQLRVHFAHLGCPLAGDELYGGSRRLIGRPALHCAAVEFTEPETGGRARAESPLPPDMEKAVLAAGANVTRI